MAGGSRCGRLALDPAASDPRSPSRRDRVRLRRGAPPHLGHRPAGRKTTYAYDAGGNRTKAGSDTYADDLAGRISAATVGGSTCTYNHAAGGDQVTTFKAGAVTNRTQWHSNAPLPILATEYDCAWAVKSPPAPRRLARSPFSASLDREVPSRRRGARLPGGRRDSADTA